MAIWRFGDWAIWRFRTFVICGAFLAAAVPASAQRWTKQQDDPPPAQIVQRTGIEQRLGERVPLDLRFRDESGREVALGDYFGKRPVVLALVYYECPMLCNQILNGLTETLRVMSLTAGRDFDVVTVSFDPNEGPSLAKAKKTTYLSKYGREGSAAGWHFLTGTRQATSALANAVGFRYEWDAQTNQWAHGAGIMVLTPGGVLSKYFYGIEYGVRDVRFGLVEASNNQIGTVADQVKLLCYRYDPMTGKYGVVILNLIRLGGAVTIVVLGTFIAVMLRRERRNAHGIQQNA